MTTRPYIVSEIARLEAKIERLRPLAYEQDELGPHFSHGVGNMTAAQAKRRQAKHDRQRQAFADLQKARADLARWQARLQALDAGEVHPNGQPRADSPTRQRKQDAKARRAAWLRSTLKPGSVVRLVAAAGEPLRTVARCNPKSIRLEGSPVTWSYNDVLPVRSDGTDYTTGELVEMLLAWEASS